MHFLIDGDVYAYFAAYSCAQEVTIGDRSFLQANHQEIKDTLDAVISAHLNWAHHELGLEEKASVIVALSDPDRSKNWRLKVLDSYKSNRKGNRRPVGFAEAEKYLRDNYEIDQRPGLEADDVLGILATSTPAVVFSTDKDMLQLPTTVCRIPFTGSDLTLDTRSLEAADRYHLFQALVGDRVDGYYGCPKIGAINAAKILDGVEGAEAWAAVVAAYEKAGLGEDDALVQARVSRIVRREDWNFKTKEVELWNPPK